MNLPSWLMTGWRLTTTTSMFVASSAALVVSLSALFVSVSWKTRRCAEAKKKISWFPSALLRVAVRLVAMSAFDSMTTKRPLPLMSPAKELRWMMTVWPGVGLGVGVGDGVGVGLAAGCVVAVIWKMAVSGVGVSVCARAAA